MSWENIHVGDFGWVGKLQIVQDGEPVNISSYTTLAFVFRKPDGTEVTKTAIFDTDGTDGWLKYTAETGLIDSINYWRVWAKIAKTGVELTSDPLSFTVLAEGSS